MEERNEILYKRSLAISNLDKSFAEGALLLALVKESVGEKMTAQDVDRVEEALTSIAKAKGLIRNTII